MSAVSVVLPGSRRATWLAASQEYCKRYSLLDGLTHILTSENGVSTSDDPTCKALVELFDPCIIYPQFSLGDAINVSQAIELCDFQFSPPAGAPISVDYLLFKQNIGAIAIFKDAEDLSNVIVLRSLFNAVFSDALPLDIWDLPGYTVDARFDETIEYLRMRTNTLLPSACDTDPTFVVPILTGMWCAKFGIGYQEVPPAHGHPDFDESGALERDVVSSVDGDDLDNVLQRAKEQLTRVCPLWDCSGSTTIESRCAAAQTPHSEGAHHRPYMLPALFEYKYKEPLIRREERAQISDGSERRPPAAEHQSQSWACASGAGYVKKDSDEDKHLRKDDAEFIVSENLERYARERKIRMLCFRGLLLSSRCDMINKFRLSSNVKDTEEEVTDFICVSPSFGICLLEVKGAGIETANKTVRNALTKSVSQLEIAERILKDFCQSLGIANPNIVHQKLVVFPFLSWNQLTEKLDKFGDMKKHVAARSYHGVPIYCMGEKLETRLGIRVHPWLLKDCIQASNNDVNQLHELYTKISPLVFHVYLSKSSDSIGTHPVFKEAEKIDQHKVLGPKAKKPRSHLERTCNESNLSQKPGTAAFRDDAYELGGKRINIYMLTPEQMRAWNGPPFQVIQGCAGTGKTVLLMAKIRNLLGVTATEQGTASSVTCSTKAADSAKQNMILVFARHCASRYSQAFAAATVGTRFQVVDLDSDFNVEDDINFPRTTEGWKDQRCRDNDFDQRLHREIDDLARLLEAGGEANVPVPACIVRLRDDLDDITNRHGATKLHILIDDANITSALFRSLASSGSRDLVMSAILIAVMYGQLPKVASLWISFDEGLANGPFGWADPSDRSALRNAVHDLLQRTVRRLPFTRTDLRSIMRNSRSVAEISHRGIDAFISHNFVGMVARTYRFDCEEPDVEGRRAREGICDIILRDLEDLRGGVHRPSVASDVAIIIQVADFEAKLRYVTRALISELEKRDIKVIYAFQAAQKRANGGALVVDTAFNCHSLEWPVVFSVREAGDDEILEAQAYVARSRATTLLVDIIVGKSAIHSLSSIFDVEYQLSNRTN